MLADRVDQWAQKRAGGADPADQQRPVKIDAFARINQRLAVHRHVAGELGDHHM